MQEIKRQKENDVARKNGLVTPELYHTGGFVGGIRPSTNEVFAKLLQGEYVATPRQMNDFLVSTLPKIIGSSQNIGQGNIDLEMNFNVAGNLDQTVVPQIEEAVSKSLNRILKKRGIQRNAASFGL